VSLKSLFSKLLVASVLDCVNFEPVRVSVDEMVLSEHVGDGVYGADDAEHHDNDKFGVGNLALGEVGQVFCNIVRHLRGGSGGSIIVLNHTVVQLWWHGDNHVIEVGVEITTLRNVVAKGGFVMETSQQVVSIVGQTDLMSGHLAEIWRPDTLVGLLRLMDSHVGWPDSVVDLALAEVPLLEVVTSVLLVTGMDLGEVDHLVSELDLSETLIDQQIVLLMHSTVAALAGSAENFETSSQSIIIN